MKMNYDLLTKRSTSAGNGKFPFLLKLTLAILVILSVLHFLVPRALPSFFTMIISPFWITEEVERVDNAQINFLIKENEELKSLLGRSETSGKILAVILKKPPVSGYDIFILDIGIDKGLVKGDRVYAPGNIPIGEIAEVNGNISKARLHSSSGEKFDVLIGNDNIQATAIGKGGGTFEVSLPHDTKIAKGDKVSIPSLSDSFLASVEDIVSESSEPFSTVLFRQPLNIYELKWVLVQKNNIEKK